MHADPSPRLPARRVRRLRVGARTDDDARHAATVLSDALGTASLPGADAGRLVVIQRLALGRIRRDASAASLALLIDRVAREAMSGAMAYDLPPAGAANAVTFPDRGSAIAALARLHARDLAAHHWFWPAIVRGWRAALPRAEKWRLLVEAAHGTPEAPIVAAAVAGEAVVGGAASELLASMAPGQGADWLRAEGWHESTPPPPPAIERTPWLERLDAIGRRWPGKSSDDRLVWLGTMIAVHEQPCRAADSRLAARVAAAIERAARCRGPSAGADVTPVASTDVDLPIARVRQETDTCGPVSSPSPPSMRAGHDAPDATSWEPTACAGLMYLVPILERLDFAAWLDAHPWQLETDFPARLLWCIGERVGLGRDDPQAPLFRQPDATGQGGDAFEAGELPAAARELLSRPRPRAPLDDPLTAWLVAVRRWCRRYARQGLVALIRRHGRVHMSRTAIDTRFDLSQIDLRLRRLALDADPGWVPWLGRVVRFHYLERDAER